LHASFGVELLHALLFSLFDGAGGSFITFYFVDVVLIVDIPGFLA